ncbi:M42 family metallopeptidase [Akkermansiaceae bacterium]|nr:M42 family metallopeptidase [Akkermansiaceae bacterium]MDC0265133.1 M42 family metallopeptidase [bacterium]MDB4272691.1 M42 family metallopeptidase [Akkermansiaceae bacterium]MDB4283160.1 M42 family metallopeptidase [Akkermansiaceae bacterium]MDB4294324.1 M42 family metallopeptidase [Akkermansiaceae bacterium]
MKAKGIALLESLTQAHSVPGYEDEVREIFVKELTEHGEIGCDKVGSVYCRKGSGPKVLVAGHMDEVGFRVQSILPNGFLKLVPVGGWWGHVLLSQRVEVKTSSGEKIIGIIASKPPHFLPEAQRTKVMGVESMFVDITARSYKEVEDWGVRLGDPVCPVSPWTPMKQPDWYMTKAFDNRVGMAGAIQVGQEADPQSCELIVAGSVQEEVGLRGAKALANLVKPDVAIVLEGPPADDTPGMPLSESQGAIGSGVQIRLHDPSAIMNPRLARFAIETAEAEGIPHQVTVRTSGGTDAGSFNIANDGIPSVVLGTPARYIHSHAGIICASDYHAMVDLSLAMVKRLDQATVDGFTKFI